MNERSLKSLIQSVVGIYFLVTGTFKCVSLSEFMNELSAYELTPDILVYPLSIIIITIEMTGGILLIFNKSVKPITIVMIIILLIITIAIIINILKGNNINCGCYGKIYNVQISWWLVIKNIIIILLIYICAFTEYKNNDIIS